MRTKHINWFFTFFLVVAFKTFGQGPNAPEAASFEPVDATDMVNLVTGDFTYVLPLMNVPSPEGGYPIALAYHGGIAMDQEASWVGLGWNLNPGAINRTVNGYADDYKRSRLDEYFYDKGGIDHVYNLSVGYSNGAVSVGLGFSWGSNRSLGGYVSVGYGFDVGATQLGGSFTVGTNGVGMNIGATFKGGLSVGVGAHSSGSYSGSVGFNNNGEGFNISANSNGSVGMNFTTGTGNDNLMKIGVTFSSGGVGITGGVTNITDGKVVGGAGSGLHMQFNNTISMGAYTMETSGYTIPVIVPTPVGIFSLSFGKQKYKYYAGETNINYVTGPIYYKDILENENIFLVEVLILQGFDNYGSPLIGYESIGYAETYDDGVDMAYEYGLVDASYIDENKKYRVTLVEVNDAFMDIHEIPILSNEIAEENKLENNNPTFPNYDKYNVQAQGLAGNMSARIYENGVLVGLTNRENDAGFVVDYIFDGGYEDDIPDYAKFEGAPYFYFDNEISTNLDVEEGHLSYHPNSNDEKITDYVVDWSISPDPEPRNSTSNYVEYFTNKELLEEYTTAKSKGYLKPYFMSDHRGKKPENGIGAFKITAKDGKTYHYSLPVYNHETITRTFGIIAARPDEDQAYYEKRQLEPYATHWLLTAVTGPDYYDKNNNGIADKGDYGYWVSFDYGKWSDGFVWKAPYGEDYFEEGNRKTWIRGRKEMYYLDKIITRTHTALFVKKERRDNKSPEWEYKAVQHEDDISQSEGDFNEQFTLPSQNSLRLEKIILIKTEDDDFEKDSGTSNAWYEDVIYNNSTKPMEQVWYKRGSDMIDVTDGYQSYLNKAIKVVHFNYDYSLAQGSPNSSSGRLTLKSVDFNGKENVGVLPPYTFKYQNPNKTYDVEKADDFGYYSNSNDAWSLNEITTPQGGKIRVNYEGHNFDPIFSSEIVFRNKGGKYKISLLPNTNGTQFKVESDSNLSMQIGDQLELDFSRSCNWEEMGNCGGFCGPGLQSCTEEGLTATVVSYMAPNTFKIEINNNDCYDISVNYWPCFNSSIPHKSTHGSDTDITATYISNNNFSNYGGVRVSSIETVDNHKVYTTKYTYGENENGLGYIAYLPYAPNLNKELPYSSELPPPKVMYDYVYMRTYDSDMNSSDGTTRYHFNVMKEKSPNSIKFEDFYEIVEVQGNELINPNTGAEVDVKEYRVLDNLASIGQLLEVAVFNKEGHLISKINNEYYGIHETPELKGVKVESFQNLKEITYDNSSTEKWLVNTSSRNVYPTLLKSSTETKGGYTYTSTFDELDNITGIASEIYSYSSKGDQLKTKTVPAYHKYGGMGSKVTNYHNENMLTQNAMAIDYMFDEDQSQWREISASISTWNNEWEYPLSSGNFEGEHSLYEKVWRKHRQYIWDGDSDQNGFLLGFTDNFDWTPNANQPDEWKKISQINHYDHFTHVLESEDINGNKVASVYDKDDAKVMYSGNAAYGELFYSGAEEREWWDSSTNYYTDCIKENNRTNQRSHTGLYSEKVNAGEEGFKTTLKANKHKAGKYKLSVWVEKSNHSQARIKRNGNVFHFNGESVAAGNWVLKNHYLNLTTSGQEISITSNNGTIYLDDFRIHPIASQLTSYVYNDWGELWYILGGNNLAQMFTYDPAGNLKSIHVEVLDDSQNNITGGFKLKQKNKYNYKRN